MFLKQYFDPAYRVRRQKHVPAYGADVSRHVVDYYDLTSVPHRVYHAIWNLPSIGLASFGRFHLSLWPGIQHYTIRLALAHAECLGNAGKVVPVFRSMCLTMPAYLLNDGIFNHPSLLRVT